MQSCRTGFVESLVFSEPRMVKGGKQLLQQYPLPADLVNDLSSNQIRLVSVIKLHSDSCD